MALLDAKGRLFGKISLLDLGAGLIILGAIVGIFFYPGTSGSVAQVGVKTVPVEVDVMTRGLTVRSPEALLETFQAGGKLSIVVRNQPYGEVDIKAVQTLPRSVSVPQPDGSVIALPDPRPELNYTVDLLLTLGGDAQVNDSGVVFGNNKVKIGTPIEVEGFNYNFNTSVVEVRILEAEAEAAS